MFVPSTGFEGSSSSDWQPLKAHLQAVDFQTALVIDVYVFPLRRCKELLVMQESHVPHRLPHLSTSCQEVCDTTVGAGTQTNMAIKPKVRVQL